MLPPGLLTQDLSLTTRSKKNFDGADRDEAMREQGISNVELARRLEVTEAVVRRLLNPDHSSKIEKMEAALEALGKRLIVEAA